MIYLISSDKLYAIWIKYEFNGAKIYDLGGESKRIRQNI